MTTFKNVSGHPLDIPSLDLRIPIDGSFDVDEADAHGLLTNPAFELDGPAPAPITPDASGAVTTDPAEPAQITEPAAPATETEQAPASTDGSN